MRFKEETQLQILQGVLNLFFYYHKTLNFGPCGGISSIGFGIGLSGMIKMQGLSVLSRDVVVFNSPVDSMEGRVELGRVKERGGGVGMVDWVACRKARRESIGIVFH